MTDKEQITLEAVADFIDYLCDHDLVVAKQYHGDWIPISETEGEEIARQFMAVRFP